MGRLLLKFMVGGLAGLLAWMIMEPLAPSHISDEWAAWELKFILALGSLIGLSVGGLDGFFRGGKLHTIRGMVLGLVFGAIGATAGHSFGSIANLFPFPPETPPWRIIALTPLGLCLGAAIGASSLNMKRVAQGAVGGLIGGGFGAAVFDAVGSVVGTATLAAKGIGEGQTGEVGTISRAIFAVAMGAMIGLFIGIIERVARSAWVRLVVGRNEGKEWVVDSVQTFLGRSERAQIPLFGDPNIAPMHACILKVGPGQYALADGGSPVGTLLNGQRIQGQVPLPHGSTIQIGSFNLQFLLRNQPAPVRGPEAYPGQAYPLQGQPYQQPQPNPYAPQAPTPYPPQGPVGPNPYGPPTGMPTGMPTQAYPAPGQQPTQAYPQAPQAMPASGYALVAMDGPLTGQRFEVRHTVDVGREQPAIPISFDTMSSRRHATLTPEIRGLKVADLNSTNGTFVNGQRISMQTVRHGDLVKIGATTFRVEAL